MKCITLLLTEKTPKATYYCVYVDKKEDTTESHMFEIRADDEGISRNRMMEFIKEICNRLEDNL